MSRGNSLIVGVVLIGLLGTLSVALQATAPTTDSSTQVAATLATETSNSAPKTETPAPVAQGCKAWHKNQLWEDGKKGEMKYEVINQEKYDGCVKSNNQPPNACQGNVEFCQNKNLFGPKDAAGFNCEPARPNDKCDPNKTLDKSALRASNLQQQWYEARSVSNVEKASKIDSVILANRAADKSFSDGLDRWFNEKQADIDTKIAEQDKIISNPQTAEAEKLKAYEDRDKLQAQYNTLAADRADLQAGGPPGTGKDDKTQVPGAGKDEKGDPNKVPRSGDDKNTPGQQPGFGNQQQCQGLTLTLGLCSQNQTGQGQCIRSYQPLIIENRLAGPGCLNYQQQCGLIQTIIGGCQQQQQQYNPYNQQQCSPQYYCMNNALYWGSPYSQQQNPNQYYYGYYGYSQQTCQSQVVQQCQYGCAPATNQGLIGASYSAACAPNPNQSGAAPQATISCGERQQRDIGERVEITFSCADSTLSTGSGFSTGGQLSGTAEVAIQRPPLGTDTVSYGLTCRAASGQTAANKCDIRINVPSIVIVATPRDIDANGNATLGWITSGMDSCVIGSPDPDLTAFNNENKGNTSVSGTVRTPSLDEDTKFVLTCTTKSGQTKSASVIVDVRGSNAPPEEVIQ